MTELEHARAEVRAYLTWALPDIQRDPEANLEWRRLTAEREAFSVRITHLQDGTPIVRPAWDERKGEELVARARDGDPAAHRALIGIADGWLGEHPLPPALSSYCRDQWHGRGPNLKRGREPNEDRARHIVAAVQLLLDYGLTATRNEASDRTSASLIVAEILAELGVEIKERGVEDVWRNRQRPGS